jgi:hypothetical protein
VIDLTAAGLVQIARHFYPTGYPVTSDEYGEDGLVPYQRTPEYARFLEAWDKAMAWPEWKTLRLEARSVFERSGDCTQPRGASCRRYCVYLERPLPDSARHLTYVAAAVSVLAPVYLVYCTTGVVVDKQREERHVFLEVPEEVRPQAATLSALIERVLGYQALPLQLANVRVPGLRVSHLYRDEEPTLLDALIDTELDSLF